MKIGVVSDTHSLEVPQQLWDDFQHMDLIIHAGDFCTMEDFKAFSRVKELKAVCGNMDGDDLRRVLPRRQVFQVEGVTIGVFHGMGAPEGVRDVLRDEFKNDKVDAIVFGHTHQPFHQVIDNVLYFNPGSPSDLAFAPYRSYGILEVKAGQISGKIIRVKPHHG